MDPRLDLVTPEESRRRRLRLALLRAALQPRSDQAVI
jgi:hypothetical protein